MHNRGTMKNNFVASRAQQLWMRVLFVSMLLAALSVNPAPGVRAQGAADKGQPPRTALEAAATADSYEPDDTMETAHVIAAGAAQTHSISPATDADWVKFTLTATSSVSIETMATDP